MEAAELKRISVVGLGKLGLPFAACFARKGFPTVGLDVDPKKVEAVNARVAPFFEPGLQEMMEASQRRLTATGDYEEVVMNSEATFLVVPTPSDEGGGFSLRYVLESVGRVGDVVRTKSSHHLVVLVSTVLPGAIDSEVRPLLESRSGKRCGGGLGLCYNPQLIALGSVIRDFLNPDFILIGESDPLAGAMLEALYRKVCDNSPQAARMNFVNAEMTKIAINTFVTSKISFANMLARMCERLPGADVNVVTSALGLDRRIGGTYLKGAIGYGGPCFPRDNRALCAFARLVGAPATLAEATDSFNRQQTDQLAALIKEKLPLRGKVGILGLAYKPNTDVVEESQGLLVAAALSGQGIEVVAYDPAAAAAAKQVLGNKVVFTASARDCIQEADVIVVTTPWEEFQALRPQDFSGGQKRRTIIDCWRIFDSKRFSNQIEYIPLGVGSP